VDLSKVDNVLDRWIMAATVTLTRSVKEEMEAYRLYNVVPQLLTFIEQLTNIYVRFNRKRLKGGNGPTDTINALGTLYHVLVTLCKVRRPLPPLTTFHLTTVRSTCGGVPSGCRTS
jgi:isoleucyl-tRNA synthetase